MRTHCKICHKPLPTGRLEFCDVVCEYPWERMVPLLAAKQWRYIWWSKLVQTQPEVAKRLIEKFPNEYPVKDPNPKED